MIHNSSNSSNSKYKANTSKVFPRLINGFQINKSFLTTVENSLRFFWSTMRKNLLSFKRRKKRPRGHFVCQTRFLHEIRKIIGDKMCVSLQKSRQAKKVKKEKAFFKRHGIC